MAKSSAKKQLQENQTRLTFLRILLIVSNVGFVVLRLVVFRSSTTWNTYLAAAAMSGIQVFCFTAVSRMAEPLLGPDGEILDGGADLLNASIASYYQDLIYLCAFVQVVSVVTDKAFWAFWLIPLVGGWIIYTSIIKPYILQASAVKRNWLGTLLTFLRIEGAALASSWCEQEAAESDVEKKRREKAERKASRPKFHAMR